MNINEFISNLRATTDALIQSIEQTTLIASNDAIALLQQRVQETGIDANGNAFEDYTPAYKKSKTKKGKYSGHVDLTVSGEMWRSIGITEERGENGIYTAVIGGRDENTKDLIKYNSDHRNFMILSESEIKTITDIYEENITNDFVKILFR